MATELTPPVLALNSGSCSLKFGLYRVGPLRTEMLLSGEAKSIGEETSRFRAKDARGNALLCERFPSAASRTPSSGLATLADTRMPAPAAIGHRVVHGGPKLRQHCFIDESVLQQLEFATPFARAYSIGALVDPVR